MKWNRIKLVFEHIRLPLIILIIIILAIILLLVYAH